MAPLLAAAPTIEAEHSSGLTASSATVSATVNPHGEEVTGCKFEYGTTTKYGFSSTCGDRGTGTAEREVSATLKGLAAATTYHFRVVATSRVGTTNGADETLKTATALLPAVKTGEGLEVTETSATLSATVDPNGEEVTTCRFEYGTSGKYSSSVRCEALPGAGTTAVGVSAVLKGLKPNTTYNFRISATTKVGTSRGAAETLTTAPTQAPLIEAVEGTEVTDATASLIGTVNPNGEEVTVCKFEYGTTAKYGLSAACSEPPGSGTIAVEESAPLTGLKADTTYHLSTPPPTRTGPSSSPDQTFTTAV